MIMGPSKRKTGAAGPTAISKKQKLSGTAEQKRDGVISVPPYPSIMAVFATTELLEAILLDLQHSQNLLTAMFTYHGWREVVHGSTRLKRCSFSPSQHDMTGSTS